MQVLSISLISLLMLFLSDCARKPALGTGTTVPAPSSETVTAEDEKKQIVLGAEQLLAQVNLLEGKSVSLVVNQTSVVQGKHLVDQLLQKGVQIDRIFAPEHGFRGTADAGEQIKDGKDAQTGLPVISLYGKKKKPAQEDLAKSDVIIFDIQDVGARFYTYISTMSYMMEACAEAGKPLWILDRPNPNGHYVDGPVLDPAFSSFVGLHPIPVVHGMTVGEYAQMVNGEGWLPSGKTCEIKIFKCQNYTHGTPYTLPIKPSPNLPNQLSIYLYPSLCFFEGTTVSVGRGTPYPFQHFGHPDYAISSYVFTPTSGPGSKYPKHENKACFGVRLADDDPERIREEGQLNLSYLLKMYEYLHEKGSFFLKNKFIDKLAGSDQLRLQIEKGMSEEEIRASWKEDLDAFKTMRERYLVYD